MKASVIQYKSHLLATDLDNTLVGNQQDLKDLTELFQSSPDDIALVYVTGRHASSIQHLISKEHLPVPDLVISDVGTKIWHMPGWKEDITWRKLMEARWDPERVKELAFHFPELTLQHLPDDCRVSFTVKQDPETVRRFKHALEEQNIAHQFIYSSDQDVDVLPEGAGKGNALDYVIQKFFNPSVRILVAGDSGNDVDMVNRAWPSVIVGNAHEELKNIPDRPNLYRAERHFAGGIHEAWCHFYGTQK